MNYSMNSFVNQNEADALKDMIFKRVRERSQHMTDNIQADVMNIARESFVSNNNPFSQILKAESNSTKPQEQIKTTAQKTEVIKPNNSNIEKTQTDVGFPQKRNIDRAVSQNKIIKEQLTASQIQNNMIEARDGLSSKKSFMGALAFLNSQAAVSLLRTRSDKFEAIA